MYIQNASSVAEAEQELGRLLGRNRRGVARVAARARARGRRDLVSRFPVVARRVALGGRLALRFTRLGSCRFCVCSSD